MGIRVGESIHGFIAGEPQLTSTRTGRARVYLRVGQDFWGKDEQGNWAQTQDTEFHDVELFGRAATEAYKNFKAGDRFVADGQTRGYERDINGEIREVEIFRARRIGHDTARTTYTVERPTEHGADPQAGQAPVGPMQHPSTRNLTPAGAEGQPADGQTRTTAPDSPEPYGAQPAYGPAQHWGPPAPAAAPAKSPIVRAQDLYL